jgi:hypothetical protein
VFYIIKNKSIPLETRKLQIPKIRWGRKMGREEEEDD